MAGLFPDRPHNFVENHDPTGKSNTLHRGVEVNKVLGIPEN